MKSLHLDEDLLAIRRQTQEFVAKEVVPHGDVWEREGSVPRAVGFREVDIDQEAEDVHTEQRREEARPDYGRPNLGFLSGRLGLASIRVCQRAFLSRKPRFASSCRSASVPP